MPKIKDKKKYLTEIYGFEFPDSFFSFWEFSQELPEDAIGGLCSTLSISLAEVFDIFQDDFEPDNFNPIEDSRYYNDPPEFFTMLRGHTDGLHWGYYIDDPNNPVFQVAYYYARDAFEISVSGNNLFETVRYHLEQFYDGTLEEFAHYSDYREENEASLKELNEIREILQRYDTADRPEMGAAYTEKYYVQRAIIAKTRDYMGIVVPVHLYKPLAGEDKFQIWNYKPSEWEVAEYRKEALQALQEGYPGTALKLGKDLWIYQEFSDITCELLDLAYEALGRNVLRKMLDFRRNRSASQVKAFQEALQNPQETKYLSLYSDRIDTLPPEIGELTQLESLNLNYNNLKDLPEELGRLSNLQELYLVGNYLDRIPDAICNLTQLRKLDLRENPLAEICDRIGKLTLLEELCLGHENLTKFPVSLCRLTSLKKLYITASNIAELPPEIGKISALEELLLATNTHLDTVPSSFKDLQNLKLLTYKYYQNEHHNYEEPISLPSAFCELPNLECLEFDTNRNIVIPSDIAKLANTLQSLKIGCYTLQELSPGIMQLQNLKELTVSCASITKIPADICQLSQLENLNLYGNRIRHIPKTLGQMKNLKSLNLSRNCLPTSETEKLAQLLPNTEIECTYQHT
ncbi:ADP-ribosylation family protein [Aerosakkonema funiforme]|uniref:leucine-rich repeat domain-containing protein n=1 Tax=Aerosakkonema funiforme TaxID=1246630 RepID=UPI0035BA103F